MRSLDDDRVASRQVAKSASDKGALSAVGQGRHLPRSESVRVVPHALDDLRAVTRRFLLRSRGYCSGVGRARDHHLQCLMRTLLVVGGDPISDTKLALNGGDCSLQLILAALLLCKRIRLLLRCAVPQGGDIPVKCGDYYLHYQDQLLEKLLKLLKLFIDFRRNCRDDDPWSPNCLLDTPCDVIRKTRQQEFFKDINQVARLRGESIHDRVSVDCGHSTATQGLRSVGAIPTLHIPEGRVCPESRWSSVRGQCASLAYNAPLT